MKTKPSVSQVADRNRLSKEARKANHSFRKNRKASRGRQWTEA